MCLLIDAEYLCTAVFDGLYPVGYPVIRSLACVFGRCGSSLLQYLLMLSWHVTEEIVVHDERYQMRQVVRLNDIILLLVKSVGYDNLIWVLLRVDGMLLKAYIHLGEAHRRWVSSYGFPEVEMERILHGSYLLSLKVSDPPDRFVCTHHAEALIGDAQQFVSAIFIDAAYKTAELRIIEHFPALIEVFESAWHIEYREIGHEGHLRRRVLHHERDVSVLARFQKLAVSSKRGVCVDLYLYLSVAESVHLFGELLGIDLSYSVLRARSRQRIGISLLSPVASAAGQQTAHKDHEGAYHAEADRCMY